MMAQRSAGSASGIPDNEIWYTTFDEKVYNSMSDNDYGANIISNTYDNGKGVLKFDGDVTKLIGYAFEDSMFLTSIIFPDSLTEIGDYAFNAAEVLGLIWLGSGIKSIGERALSSAGSVLPEVKLYIPTNTPPLIGMGDLGNISNFTIYVPNEAVYTYTHDAVWIQVQNQIVGYDFKNNDLWADIQKK